MRFNLPDPKKIVLFYLIAGVLLIFLTSQLATPELSFSAFSLEQLKELLFVLVTAFLLFLLLSDYRRQLNSTLNHRRQTESQFRNLYEESPQPTWIIDEEKKLLFINKAAKKLLGQSAEKIMEILPEVPSFYDYETVVEEKGEKGEVQQNVHPFVSASGKLLYLDLVVRRISFGDRNALLVIANNVTKLMQAEKEKRRITNELYHYKKALDRSALLSVTDLDGVIRDVNSKFCEVSKFSSEELIGQDHKLLNSGYHSSSFFQNMYRTILQGEVWRGEICNKAKDGALFWVDMSVVPVMDEFNEVGRYMAISYPITDRKAAELKSEKVQQELATFMYKASHNLRGPVATLGGLLNIARIEVKEPNSLNYLQMLDERTKHIEYTLGELIDITKVKQEELCVSTIHFEQLVKKVFRSFKKEIKENQVRVETLFQLNAEFNSDPKLLSALFHYLIDNAIKFRKNMNPCIHIHVRSQGGGVFISVSDNGPGIAEDIRERIFEMYFRGSEKSTGSGLGLYIVSSIVDRLEGYITLYSKRGKGSTFTIFLPDTLQEEKRKERSDHTYLPDKSLYQPRETRTDSLQPD